MKELRTVQPQGLRKRRAGTTHHLRPTREFFSLLDEHFSGQLIMTDDHRRCSTKAKRIDGTILFLQLEEVDMHMTTSGEKRQAAHQGQEWKAPRELGIRCL